MRLHKRRRPKVRLRSKDLKCIIPTVSKTSEEIIFISKLGSPSISKITPRQALMKTRKTVPLMLSQRGICIDRRSDFLPKSIVVILSLLRIQGIDSQPAGPVRQPRLTYRPAMLQRLAKSIPGYLKRLQIRALYSN